MKMKHTEGQIKTIRSSGDEYYFGHGNEIRLEGSKGNLLMVGNGNTEEEIANAARLALAWNCHQEFKEALEQTLLAMLDHAGWVKNFAPDGKELPMSRPSRVQKAEALARAILAKASSAE